MLRLAGWGQFPPPAGQPGSTAIHKDSSVFVGWATGCTVLRGPKNIADLSLGLVSYGDSTKALGVADNSVVSLGDGGQAVLTFAHPIADGPGWDFAVFENGFSDTFLELAFVEVSSDGEHFVRFPATSLTQDSVQVGPFGSLDATQIDNLAGKYRTLYGTPFDLQVLAGHPGLNVQAITHVRVVDVVGSIQPAFASYDQYGNAVNDPWPTPFESGGFDLDAVGVIHTIHTAVQERPPVFLNLSPQPARDFVILMNSAATPVQAIHIFNGAGQKVQSFGPLPGFSQHWIPLNNLPAGWYFAKITMAQEGEVVLKLLISK
ncbi:MAG: T9SS type A sorting domain-containing protein [Flavobacteriales bacterium]|nr:T9SS type A sorting domain-containing protein [Flavobacteriales bacterium]MCX7767747.1 T9SS type A sorting domain-containing protein [Flavobacteriales bacterium]MDW8409358.1 T9SS type A sorting domain-containing protein [Flavobacteriales bacterium]